MCYTPVVMPGLDPGMTTVSRNAFFSMDCPVNPGNDAIDTIDGILNAT
jgi:hypothetical protein